MFIFLKIVYSLNKMCVQLLTTKNTLSHFNLTHIYMYTDNDENFYFDGTVQFIHPYIFFEE